MKNLILSLCLTGCIATVSAQQQSFWKEDFSSGRLPDGWSIADSTRSAECKWLVTDQPYPGSFQFEQQSPPIASTSDVDGIFGGSARAMVLEYPDDPITRGTTTQYQFMSGEWMLVAPVYKRGNQRDSIYFPAGEWYDYWNGEKYEGGHWLDKYEAKLDICPVFIRQGAIIPMFL